MKIQFLIEVEQGNDQILPFRPKVIVCENVEEQPVASARIINPSSKGSCAGGGNDSDETKDQVRSSIEIRASSLGVTNLEQKVKQDVDQNGETSIEFIGNAEGFRESNYSAIKDSKLDALDTDHSCSDHLDRSSVVNSVPTCSSSRGCSLLERGGPQNEESMKCPYQLLLLKEEEPVEGCNTSRLTKPESEISSNTKTLGLQKPKRRLLPASSILLKDFSALDLDDESEKPKGRRGEKNLAADERKRTQGSLSLLRLLKSNLHV
ncbi:hypothetical protein RJ641_032479 [Dillenia turbinata]|uniref:Uncharacterized protein n=1 Tax=Dillenia turbinata TaxID=194707 RepID=A0AAN8ZIA9_9MAGN